MYYLSIATIIKNEDPYLKEWIETHLLFGVEHFFLYDNDNTIPLKITLKEYIDKGIIDVIDFPGPAKQMPAFNHCLQNYGNLSKWICFSDVDEFLLPKKHDNLQAILKDYEQFACLSVNWLVFGSSGHIEKPPGLVIENYTKCGVRNWYENTHCKSIVQPHLTLRAGSNPHHFIYKNGYHAVSENKEIVQNAWAPNSTNIIQLNHYFTKSLSEFKEKIARGRSDTDIKEYVRKVDQFYEFEGYCTDENKDIFKWIDKVKLSV
jgi:hypothetical protein